MLLPPAPAAKSSRPSFAAFVPKATDLRPARTAQLPAHSAGVYTPALRPAAAATGEAQVGVAMIQVQWQPSTEVFEFCMNDGTTASDLKDWLARRVACYAAHMHLVFGATQLQDHVPLSQYVGGGDTLLAHPKRGG